MRNRSSAKVKHLQRELFRQERENYILPFIVKVTWVAGYLAQSTAEHRLPAHVDRTELNTITTISH